MSTIKSSTLQAMLDDVANDFIDALKTKQESLAKSELRKDFPPKKEDESEPSKEASDSAPADASASAGPSDAPEAAPAPGADAPAPGLDAGAPAPDAGMGDPAADQQLDPAALQAEYAKLSPDELEMHLQAAMAAKQALAGAMAPVPDASAAAPAPAPAAPAPEMKSEASAGEKSKKAVDAMKELEKSVVAKSEQVAASLAKTEELEKLIKAQADEIASLHAGIQKIVDVPGRKAVTAVNHVTRETAPAGSSKEWTKDTIHAHLKQISATPSLKKADRELINDFYCGVVKIDKLAHLFEEK